MYPVFILLIAPDQAASADSDFKEEIFKEIKKARCDVGSSDGWPVPAILFLVPLLLL